jgi:YVTN family beta-propeller protein
MVQWNNFLFVSCWSFDNTILVIDTRTDAVVNEIKTGKQPGGLVLDKYNKIWTLCDGGWAKSGTTSRIPMLQRIDAATQTIEKSFSLTADAKPSRLAINGTGDSLLFINDGIWKIRVNQATMVIFLSYQLQTISIIVLPSIRKPLKYTLVMQLIICNVALFTDVHPLEPGSTVLKQE